MAPQPNDTRLGVSHQTRGANTSQETGRAGRTTLGNLSLCLAGSLAAAAILCAAPDRAYAGGALSVPFDPANFTDNPLVIDNPYWPLSPDGLERTFTFVATTAEGCEIEEATVRKVGDAYVLTQAPYAGPAIEVEDIGYIDENCDMVPEAKTEHTLDWYRQDNDGNVWYLGELSISYEADSEGANYDCSDDPNSHPPDPADMIARPLCYVGSWEAGKPAGGDFPAEPGIVVPSNTPMGKSGRPLKPGMYYLQEFAENAMDVAKVLKTDANVKYKIDGMPNVFRHCRVTKEYSSLDHGAIEQKNYCPGEGGLVVVEEFHGGKTQLVVLRNIDPPLPALP